METSESKGRIQKYFFQIGEQKLSVFWISFQNYWSKPILSRTESRAWVLMLNYSNIAQIERIHL